MRKALSASSFAFCALLVLGLVGLPAYGQDRDEKTNEHPNGIVHDWSNRHVVYPRWGEIHALMAVQNDPRAIQSWQEASRRDWHWYHNRNRPRVQDPGIHKDWVITLGNGSMASSMYPAKFGFYPTATPTCIIGGAVTTPDFVVFTVNEVASATLSNIVAFQDLYSGTAGGTGLCDTQRPTYFTTDLASSASLFWAYAIKAADGVVTTSPALSLDGTKVAFVEKGGGGTAHFHVLAYNGGTTSVGGDGTTGNSRNLGSPKLITSGFSLVAPAAGSGTVTDLILTPVSGTASDTLSSPFVDMTNDVAYVGNDSGTIFRIKNVFCTLAACTPGASAAPSFDASWGTGGALATGCSLALTGVVYDGAHVFAGCADGKLYGFNSSDGSALTGSPLVVGNGTGLGGIVDPPLVDVVNGHVYVATAAANGTGFPVVVQTGTSSFSTTAIATLGATAAGFNLHAPALNNAYFTSGTPANWMLYEYSNSASGGSFTFWGIPFTGAHAMTAGTPTNSHAVTAFGNTEISPLTEFPNGANDWIFASALTPQVGNVVNWNVAAGFPASITTSTSVAEGTGTTGFIVDNTGADPQESSFYFGTLGGGGSTPNAAVKLTQSGLQ